MRLFASVFSLFVAVAALAAEPVWLTDLDAAKAHSFTQAENLRQSLNDPTARKLVQWAIISNDGADIYGFAALDIPTLDGGLSR